MIFSSINLLKFHFGAKVFTAISEHDDYTSNAENLAIECGKNVESPIT